MATNKGFGGGGQTGDTAGRSAAFGVPVRKNRQQRVQAVPTYVNSGRKGSGVRGGTGGKKAK